MYNYLRGIITVIDPRYIVLEVNNIGYEILVSNPYQYELEKEMKIYTYQIVREDELSLCGFQEKQQKDLFLDLISVKGIGPKTALLILAATTVQEFQKAVVKQNVEYLSKFPKIGQKSARQIILDLEKKYENLNFDANFLEKKLPKDELTEALIALGYDNKAIKKIIPQVDSDLKIDMQVKIALKLLLKI